MSSADLAGVSEIADQIHKTLPERPEVVAEKIRLFPEGCLTLVADGRVVGYGIAHPWLLHSVPPLDEYLGALPAKPECLYIHDVAVLPLARGQGAMVEYVAAIKRLGRQLAINSLALVSVYGTNVLWRHFGFEIVDDPALAPKLASYGASAKYMVFRESSLG